MRVPQRFAVAAITTLTLVAAGQTAAHAGADVIPEPVQVVDALSGALHDTGIAADAVDDSSALFTLPPFEVVGAGEVESQATAVTTDLVAYPGALTGTDVLFGEDDAQSGAILFRLRNAQAAPDLSVTIDNPDGHLERQASGAVNIVDGTGAVVGTISQPWARDAAGRALPTSFAVSGNTVTQHVDTTGAVYPVTADPKWTWGIITGTVYFNKHETSVIAASSDWVNKLSIFIPGIWSTIIGLYAAVVHAMAKHAKEAGGCVKLKSTGVPGIYFGGYCK